MSEQPDDVTLTQNEDAHLDPFEGNSVRIAVTRVIDVGQLMDEISARTKTPVQVVISLDDPNHLASESRPAVLFVSPGNINERVVRDVVANHVARPVAKREETGAPQAPSNTINPSLMPEEVQGLVQKLKDGETLKTSEASDLLRAVFGIEDKG